MILLDKYVKFLTTYEITEKQFLALLLAYSKRQDLIGLYKRTFTKGKDLLTVEDKGVLLNKGLIEIDKASGLTVLSKKFLDIFIDKDVATEEIYELYPTTMPFQGVEIPLKGMDRSVFATLYQNAIHGSVEEHEEVKLDIQYAITHNLLNIGIEKFIKSRYWLGIRQARLENKKVINTKTVTDNEF